MNGDSKLTLGSAVVKFVGALILIGAGTVISATLGNDKDVAALKVKADNQDAELKRQDARLDRIEQKIDRILERVANKKE